MAADIHPVETDIPIGPFEGQPDEDEPLELAIVRRGIAPHAELSPEAAEPIVAPEGRRRNPVPPSEEREIPGETPPREAGSGSGNEPPFDEPPSRSGEYPDDGDGGEDPDGPYERRRLVYREVRPALRQVVALLEEREVDVDAVLRSRPAQRDVLPDLLAEDTDLKALSEEKGIRPATLASHATRMLTKLIEAAREAGIEADRLPQPEVVVSEISPPDPTKIVGPWLGAMRERTGRSYEALAERTGRSATMLQRFLNGRVTPQSAHDSLFIAEELGLDEATATIVWRAMKAERRGDYEEARALIGSIQLPVSEPDETIPETTDESVPAEALTGDRHWAPGQLREALRQLVANEVDVAALVNARALTRKTAQKLAAALPVLLSGQTNSEVGEHLGVPATRVNKVARAIIDLVRDDVPPELRHLTQPAGALKDREPDPIGGGIKQLIEATGLTQADVARRAGISDSTLHRLLWGEAPQSHPGASIEPTLAALQDMGVISQDEAAGYLRQYNDRRRRLISGGQETQTNI